MACSIDVNKVVRVGNGEMPNNHFLRPRGIKALDFPGGFYLSHLVQAKIINDHMTSTPENKGLINVGPKFLHQLLVSTFRKAKPLMVTQNECIVLRWHTKGPVGIDLSGQTSHALLLIVSISTSHIVSLYPDFCCPAECIDQHDIEPEDDWYLPEMSLFMPQVAEIFNRPVSHLLLRNGIKPAKCGQKNGFFKADMKTLDLELMRKWAYLVIETYWPDIKESSYIRDKIEYWLPLE